MIRKVRKLLFLAPGERRLLLQAVALLPLVTCCLRALGLRRSLRLLARSAAVGNRASVPDEATARRVALRACALVGMAATHGPFRGSCLVHALTAWWLLSRRGIAGELRIGIRRVAMGLEAHAWLEYRGCALGPAMDADGPFMPFGAGRELLARSEAPSP